MTNEAFIDGQNLYYNTKNSSKPWKIDLKRFRIYLKEKYNVEKAYYFIGFYIDTHNPLYRIIQEAGFILIFREHNEKMDSIKKGNVDTDIVFEMMKKYADREKFDKIILVSGDGDYFKTVKYLIEKEKFLRLLAPSMKHMSSLYKALSPTYYSFLDCKEIKSKIKISKK